MASSSFVYVCNAGSGDLQVLGLGDEGSLTPLQRMAYGGMATAFTLSPDQRFLYVARRSLPWAAVCFARDASSGLLAPLGEDPLVASMAYLSCDGEGRWLLGASYDGGLVSVNGLMPDGRVGAPVQVEAIGPKAHAIRPGVVPGAVHATSLGGGRLLHFTQDEATGWLHPQAPATLALRPESGPRHFCFHPDGKTAYVLNELDGSLDVLAVAPRTGGMQYLETLSILPPGFAGVPWAADLHLSPDGRFLYASERRSSTLACLAVGGDGRHLELRGHTPTETQPRSFALSPCGHFLLALGQGSGALSCYRTDPVSGGLQLVGRLVVGDGPSWIEVIRAG